MYIPSIYMYKIYIYTHMCVHTCLVGEINESKPKWKSFKVPSFFPLLLRQQILTKTLPWQGPVIDWLIWTWMKVHLNKPFTSSDVYFKVNSLVLGRNLTKEEQVEIRRDLPPPHCLSLAEAWQQRSPESDVDPAEPLKAQVWGGHHAFHPVRGIPGHKEQTSRRAQADRQSGGPFLFPILWLLPIPVIHLTLTLLLQDPLYDTPQDVTYAQLNHLTLRQKTSAPSSSPSEKSPREPSVYAALAIC